MTAPYWTVFGPGFNVADVATWAGSVMVIVTSAAYAGKKLRHVARLLEALSTVVGRELNPNHGSSMKDDLAAVAQALDTAHGRIDQLEQTVSAVEDALHTIADSNRHIWPAIEAVANARPPWPEDEWKESRTP